MAVYSIYISYYTDSNSVFQTAETKLYDIPVAVNHPNLLIEPKVKTEMGKTGSFEFSMYYGHPYYNCWKQMKTMMRVEYYGETIFYGRVLTIDVDHITSKKTIHCEGYLAFLMDSQQEGVPDSERERVAAGTYITSLITNHNTQVNAGAALATEASPPKAFVKGMVPGNYTGADSNQQIKMESENVKFGSSGWQDTASAFSSLIKEYGGYLRTRYVDANTIYLDWLDAYFRDTATDRVIEVGENVISLSSSAEVENIFTVLIPVGKNSTDSASSDAVFLTPKELYVKDIASIYSDAELNTGYHNKADYQNSLNDYGVIYKVQNFSNADTVDKLRTWAWDWIKNNYHGGLTSFTATAIDMKILGGSDVLLAGDQVKVKYPTGTGTAEKIMTVLSAEYDLVKPENNSYEIGIPDNELNRSYGEKAEKSSKASASGKSSAGGGAGKKKIDDDENKNLKNKVDHFFYSHVLDASNNNPEYAAYKEKYGEEAAASILRSTVLTLDQAVDEEGTPTAVKNAKTRLKTLLLDGHNGTLSGFTPQDPTSSVFANKSNEWMSDYYATQASVTLDTFRNSLTFKEQIQTIGEWAQEDFLNPAKRLKPLLQIGTGTQTSTQYGSIAVQRAARGTADIVTEENVTAMMGGYNGKFVGGKLQLVSGFNNNTVNSLTNDTSDTLKGPINLDGFTSTFSMFNLGANPIETLSFEGSAADPQGGNIGIGRQKIGKDANGNWLITLNDTVTYTDANGVSQTKSGFISAKDLNLPDIPSFHTKIAQIDNLIATKATIGELRAFEALLGDASEAYDEDGNFIGFEGTMLQNNSEHILGVNGKFEIDSQTGMLKIISGGGLQILRDNVAFGVYDNGTLTGGIIVDKVNDGSATTRIKGSRIIAGDDVNDESLPDWMDTTTGLVAQKATIADLNAVKARVSTIESDYATIAYLNAGFTITGGISCGGITSSSTIDAKSDISGADFKFRDTAASLKNAFKEVRTTQSGNDITLYFKNYSGAESSVTFSKATTLTGSWSGGTFTVTASPQDETFSATAYAAIYDTPTATAAPKILKVPTKVYSYVNGASTPVETGYSADLLANAAPVYNNGWGAAYGLVEVPTSASTSDSFTVKTPPSTVDGSAVNNTYTMHDASKNVATVQNSSGTVVARLEHNRYNAGWGAAAGDVSWPGTNASTKNATFKAPSSTVDGTQVSKTYYMDIVSSGYSSSTKAYLRNPDDIAVAALNVGPVFDAGVTEGESHFTAHADITPIGSSSIRVGSAISVTPISSTSIKISPTVQTRYKGNGTRLATETRYKSGDDYTHYKGDGSTVTGRGNTVTVTPIGNAVHFARHYGGTPSGTWYTLVSSGYDLTYYTAGSEKTYYKGDGSTVTGRGNTVSGTNRGDSETVYVESSSGAYYLRGDGVTAYDSSSSGTVYYTAGTAEAYYPALSSGGTVYYTAGSQVTGLYTKTG